MNEMWWTHPEFLAIVAGVGTALGTFLWKLSTWTSQRIREFVNWSKPLAENVINKHISAIDTLTSNDSQKTEILKHMAQAHEEHHREVLSYQKSSEASSARLSTEHLMMMELLKKSSGSVNKQV